MVTSYILTQSRATMRQVTYTDKYTTPDGHPIRSNIPVTPNVANMCAACRVGITVGQRVISKRSSKRSRIYHYKCALRVGVWPPAVGAMKKEGRKKKERRRGGQTEESTK